MPDIDKFFSSLKDCGISEKEYQRALDVWKVYSVTGIQLEKINNIDVHLFLEKGMRGGISYISKRYSKSEDSKTIMYWDANNLYGWAMIQDLPHSDFMFLSQKEIDQFSLNVSENSPIGYILEVHLGYCKKLHDCHSDYPLCPLCPKN